jgi:hypothetical protein
MEIIQRVEHPEAGDVDGDEEIKAENSAAGTDFKDGDGHGNGAGDKGGGGGDAEGIADAGDGDATEDLGD